ncbi:Gfo/Idh/MocA family protein [Seohaeicola zhoushanensis]|uniref:Oxidoreductase n=1 Tax=Seohaeicola zhoushanensis TaxID=1569283 RepID=A0A8J3M8R5_9RHOB|nr:Gfo/Idh/MocA family oxidoreductase [Seohaeicola zhoushanensis]GHF43854.1 oxidoreductase [Seohaeicola zhoushanensis]
MTGAVPIAVVGAGMIGRRHAEAIFAAPGVSLAAIADPAPGAREVAEGLGVPCYPGLDHLLAARVADAVILATPNQMHVEGALACIAAGLPVLVEKPLASDLDGARRIVAAGEAAGVPVATGHHRRHNPLIARAKALLDEGRLGQVATVQGTTWFLKPDDYFDTEWRRRKGAGPVYLNLIHDVDLLQHFCGPVTQVQAMESNALRGNEVEETSVILLRFASGVIGTVNVCDAAAAPWSWELTARENPVYPATGEACYLIGGTRGSLSLPSLALWTHEGKNSWWSPIAATRFPFDFADPLVLQAAQFGRVVRDGEAPVVTARDGLAALAVIEAVKQAAASGALVNVEVEA